MPTTPTPLTVFMLVRTTPNWLALTPSERSAFVDDHLRPILTANPAVGLRYFDAEFFSARITDVLVWTTPDVPTFQPVVESLRETPFWGTYFEVVEILTGIEEAFAAHYEVAPVGTAPA